MYKQLWKRRFKKVARAEFACIYKAMALMYTRTIPAKQIEHGVQEINSVEHFVRQRAYNTS